LHTAQKCSVKRGDQAVIAIENVRLFGAIEAIVDWKSDVAPSQ
jgi:hypothetical protein